MRVKISFFNDAIRDIEEQMRDPLAKRTIHLEQSGVSGEPPCRQQAAIDA